MNHTWNNAAITKFAWKHSQLDMGWRSQKSTLMRMIVKRPLKQNTMACLRYLSQLKIYPKRIVCFNNSSLSQLISSLHDLNNLYIISGKNCESTIETILNSVQPSCSNLTIGSSGYDYCAGPTKYVLPTTVKRLQLINLRFGLNRESKLELFHELHTVGFYQCFIEAGEFIS